MKYQDDAVNKTVNGFQVGVRIGSPLKDAANPTDDGYGHLRSVEHVGTVLRDGLANAVNPTPLLLSIDITTLPTKIAYLVGQALDITGMVVTGFYSGGTTGIIPVTTANVTGFNSSTPAASQTLTVTVAGFTDTFNISIT